MHPRPLILTSLLLLGAADLACIFVEPVVGTEGTSEGSSSESSSEASSSEPTGTASDSSSSDASSTDASSSEASSSEVSTSEPTGTSSTTADPEYKRDCQPGDFVCDDWGCQESTESGECYKPCTPSGEIGGTDSECDEPERPFCSQVGLALGGDFDCNGCKHICVAEPLNWCEYGADECE
ncbi:hypothetical protein [Nannocystis radixulma]|uniref:Uncharacterized protein n=1 Tax=Nannocystis radixulma TaxID=2995305 RepID=A0ABT5B538_9BACT|nr:hypothetical protein [Nannocystis radixulma]MDC0669207.1 hypothetical protein [Nannocystis radixulma]